eukprot:357811-Chlamydomonas_euryale.AAC.2
MCPSIPCVCPVCPSVPCVCPMCPSVPCVCPVCPSVPCVCPMCPFVPCVCPVCPSVPCVCPVCPSVPCVCPVCPSGANTHDPTSPCTTLLFAVHDLLSAHACPQRQPVQRAPHVPSVQPHILPVSPASLEHAYDKRAPFDACMHVGATLRW